MAAPDGADRKSQPRRIVAIRRDIGLALSGIGIPVHTVVVPAIAVRRNSSRAQLYLWHGRQWRPHGNCRAAYRRRSRRHRRRGQIAPAVFLWLIVLAQPPPASPTAARLCSEPGPPAGAPGTTPALVQGTKLHVLYCGERQTGRARSLIGAGPNSSRRSPKTTGRSRRQICCRRPPCRHMRRRHPAGHAAMPPSCDPVPEAKGNGADQPDSAYGMSGVAAAEGLFALST